MTNTKTSDDRPDRDFLIREGPLAAPAVARLDLQRRTAYLDEIGRFHDEVGHERFLGLVADRAAWPELFRRWRREAGPRLTWTEFESPDSDAAEIVVGGLGHGSFLEQYVRNTWLAEEAKRRERSGDAYGSES